VLAEADLQLLCSLQVTFKEAQQRQQELLEGLEAARQLVQEQGQELARALEHARSCWLGLTVEQHR
jgi:hypothetical protein